MFSGVQLSSIGKVLCAAAAAPAGQAAAATSVTLEAWRKLYTVHWWGQGGAGRMGIKRGIIRGYNLAAATATVQMVESHGTYLQNIPIIKQAISGTISAGDLCLVLMPDESCIADALIVGTYNSSSSPHGLFTGITPVQATNGNNIVVGTNGTAAVQVTGQNGIPGGAAAVLATISLNSTNGSLNIGLTTSMPVSNVYGTGSPMYTRGPWTLDPFGVLHLYGGIPGFTLNWILLEGYWS